MERDMEEFLSSRAMQERSHDHDATSSLEYRLGRSILKEIKRLVGKVRKRGFSKERIRAAARTLLKPQVKKRSVRRERRRTFTEVDWR